MKTLKVLGFLALMPIAMFIILVVAGLIKNAFASPEEAAQHELERFTSLYESCMQERPGSPARADCLWNAKRDYPQGYVLFITKN